MLLSVQKPTRLMEFRTTGRKFSSLPVQINVASTTDNAKKLLPVKTYSLLPTLNVPYRNLCIFKPLKTIFLHIGVRNLKKIEHFNLVLKI